MGSHAGALGLLLVAALAGLALHQGLLCLLARLARQAATPMGTMLLRRLGGPFRLLLPLGAVMLVFPFLAFPPATEEIVSYTFSLLVIAGVTWLCMGGALVGQDMILGRFDILAQDNLKARAVHTQLNLLIRVVLAALTVIAAAAMLMTFDRIRHVGLSIFASAGVIGIILGIAAQRTIATLFAGLQLAFTQPIRMGDAVIVEGEWGWVEDITLTYVVIKLWDRKVAVVQVTNCSERAMELRFLMSAPDSPKAFDLRCEVREGLLTFLQKHHPGSLPRLRAEVVNRPATSPESV